MPHAPMVTVVAVCTALGAVLDNLRVRRAFKRRIAGMAAEALSSNGGWVVEDVSLPSPSSSSWKSKERTIYGLGPARRYKTTAKVLVCGPVAVDTNGEDNLYIGDLPSIRGDKAGTYIKEVLRAYRQRIADAAAAATT